MCIIKQYCYLETMLAEILLLALGILILNAILCFTLLFLYVRLFFMLKRIKKYLTPGHVTEQQIVRNPPTYDDTTLIRTPTI